MKDMRESLLVQIRHHPSPHPRAAELVENWLEALEKQRLRDIEKGMRISEAKLKEIVAFIRTLDPLPGRNFSRDVVRYVLPDVQVTLHDGEFVIILNEEMIPVLGHQPALRGDGAQERRGQGHRRRGSSSRRTSRTRGGSSAPSARGTRRC